MAEQLPDPIVVFGAPRSGTTYLQEMLNVHPEVFVSHETRIFAWLHHALNEATEERRFLVTSKEEFVSHLRTELPGVVRDFYRSLAPEARYWGDKNPGYPDRTNGDCLRTIADVFPGAWFVHIIRDGRDVCSSLVRMKDPGGRAMGGVRRRAPALGRPRRQRLRVRPAHCPRSDTSRCATSTSSGTTSP